MCIESPYTQGVLLFQHCFLKTIYPLFRKCPVGLLPRSHHKWTGSRTGFPGESRIDARRELYGPLTATWGHSVRQSELASVAGFACVGMEAWVAYGMYLRCRQHTGGRDNLAGGKIWFREQAVVSRRLRQDVDQGLRKVLDIGSACQDLEIRVSRRDSE